MKSKLCLSLHVLVRKSARVSTSLFALASALGLQAQTGPFAPTNWPPTIDPNATVDYYIVDPNAAFSTPAGWNQSVSIGGGGDQTVQPITLAGLRGDQSTSTYVNFADTGFANWLDTPVLDILLQVYGNEKLYNANGSGKNVAILTGTLLSSPPNNLNAASAGIVPPGANNNQWNWMLFTISNSISPITSQRYVGYIPPNAGPGAQNGGVNGGTLRLETLGGIVVRAVAIGPQGAFGTSNQVNVFAAPPACPAEPDVNLAFVDINAHLTNHLVVLNNGDQTVAYQNNVGPANDLRTAVQATSTFMNFGIASNYLGVPCNFPRPMKVCVEFYDDPALAGASFGPEAYASDAQGDTDTYAGPLYTLPGSGEWVRVAFWVPNVDLAGVNTAPLTGGPRLVFNGGFPFIDRVELGIQRAGTNVLAGQDPDPAFHMDPNVCTTNYGNYAELDLPNDFKNNLDVGSSVGDQPMIVEMAGPANDQRLSIRPDGGQNNIQFSILNQVFGPTYQDNARVAQVLTYYDDPTMVGARFYPQVYQSWVAGASTLIFPSVNVVGVTLQGTDKWRDAYFELPDANFAGVNQGPQSLVRYETTPAKAGDPTSGYVHISRVRYAVIRSCGPYAGINVLQTNKPIAEFGDTVNGFQDDFTGATRNPNWVAVGPAGDQYIQQAGVLSVFANHGDANHLIYQVAAASNNVQEVLARIRVLSAQSGDGFHPGIGVGVDPSTSHGVNLAFRDFLTEDANRHFKLVADGAGSGGLAPTNLEIAWTNNVWYWLRLRQDNSGGSNSVLGKVWEADWSTPEPSDWQLLWTDASRYGYAGISASSLDALSQFEVSYALIKSAGLPGIRVQVAASAPVATAPLPPSYVGGGITLSGGNVTVSWIGSGTLQSAIDVSGPWIAIPEATNSYTVPATNKTQFFRVVY